MHISRTLVSTVIFIFGFPASFWHPFFLKLGKKSQWILYSQFWIFAIKKLSFTKHCCFSYLRWISVCLLFFSFTFPPLFCSHICDAKILKWLEHMILLFVANSFFFFFFSAISSKFSVMNSNFDDITADLCFPGTPDVRLEMLKSRENVRQNIGTLQFSPLCISVRWCKSCCSMQWIHKYSLLFVQQGEVLYEVSANSENWMLAGRKRGHVTLSTIQGS